MEWSRSNAGLHSRDCSDVLAQACELEHITRVTIVGNLQ
jgi:hypothetical protein